MTRAIFQIELLLLLLHVLLVPSVPLSIGQRVYDAKGVASLFSAGSQIFAGTKRGNVLILDDLGGPSGPVISIADELGKVDTKTYPVYSLTSSPNCLYCGCGDRYISVLRRQSGGNGYQVAQRLGPHTGWVKDLYHDSASNQLFSIGCNCIETWALSSDGACWEHVKKRTVESSPSLGSTLSSDLLCLCGGPPDSSVFYAGGVDGRIHTWSTDPTIAEPLASVSVHAGRVNGILCDSATLLNSTLLISWGHDGVLKCRTEEGDPLQVDIEIDLGDVRVTAGGITRSSVSSLELILGCSNGLIRHFQVQVQDSSDVSILPRDTLSMATDCSIQSILLLPITPDGALAALVGHAKGLDLIHVT